MASGNCWKTVNLFAISTFTAATLILGIISIVLGILMCTGTIPSLMPCGIIAGTTGVAALLTIGSLISSVCSSCCRHRKKAVTKTSDTQDSALSSFAISQSKPESRPNSALLKKPSVVYSSTHSFVNIQQVNLTQLDTTGIKDLGTYYTFHQKF